MGEQLNCACVGNEQPAIVVAEFEEPAVSTAVTQHRLNCLRSKVTKVSNGSKILLALAEHMISIFSKTKNLVARVLYLLLIL